MKRFRSTYGVLELWEGNHKLHCGEDHILQALRNFWKVGETSFCFLCLGKGALSVIQRNCCHVIS